MKQLIALVLLFSSISTMLVAKSDFVPEIVNPLTQSWRWKQFPELDGKGVRDIAEGKDKSVWFALNEGVYRYDGYHWTLYNQAHGLDDSPIEQLLVTESNEVYACSSYGIYLYKEGIWYNKFPMPERTPFKFKKLTQLLDGTIAATSNRGIVLLKNEKVTIYSSKRRIANLKPLFEVLQWIALPEENTNDKDFSDISDILLDHEDRVWIALTVAGEKGKVLSFPKEELFKPIISNYTIYSSNQQIQLGENQKIIEAQDGAIWVINSSFRAGISIYREEQWEYIKLSDQFSGDEHITDIAEVYRFHFPSLKV
ncbi:MAG: hypothetical protein AAFP82_19090, partial [Bacteroidota bacterium]